VQIGEYEEVERERSESEPLALGLDGLELWQLALLATRRAIPLDTQHAPVKPHPGRMERTIWVPEGI